MTEFKYYVGPEVHKVYLSAILDLYDRRIVAYAMGDHNDNRLVFDTFDAAVSAHPEAHPLFHSDYVEKETMTKNIRKCNVTKGSFEKFGIVL